MSSVNINEQQNSQPTILQLHPKYTDLQKLTGCEEKIIQLMTTMRNLQESRLKNLEAEQKDIDPFSLALQDPIQSEAEKDESEKDNNGYQEISSILTSVQAELHEVAENLTIGNSNIQQPVQTNYIRK